MRMARYNRGQVTTPLFQRGIDPAITDFPWLADTREKTS